MYEVSDGARTNDEVNIIECLVFIKATAETQRGWGRVEGVQEVRQRRWKRVVVKMKVHFELCTSWAFQKHLSSEKSK